MIIETRREDARQYIGSGTGMSDEKPKLVTGKPPPVPLIENIYKLQPATLAFIEPDRILEHAKGDFDMLLVIGWNKERKLDVRSSHSDDAENNWLIDKAKRWISENE